MRTAVRYGVLRPVARGVYLVAGAPRSWEQQTVIATTALGGVASHRCAARLHRLDGFADAPVELTLPRSGTRRHLDGVVLHWTRSMSPAMTTTVQGIRVTTLARTLADLGGIPDVALVTLATDGGDGPTDAAGAVVTGESLSRAEQFGLQPDAYLRRNDAYHFFDTMGELIRTGPTRTNVNDLAFLFAW